MLKRWRWTIARKLALAITAIVLLCLGTMAWVTNLSLQRGFVSYLNQLQTQDLDQLRVLLEQRYRREGNFEWLRGRPRVLGDLVAEMQPQLQADAADPRPPRGRPEGRRGPPPADGPPGYGRPAPPPRPRADPPPNRHDPVGFLSRISIVDADGRNLIGPPDFPPGIERDIKVDGQVVGRMRLLPLRQASGSDASAAGFLRDQLRNIVLLACALLGLAILAAIWLARHLLRPVAALRDVTAQLARGEFAARAPLLSRDELAELALHVNAMAEALQASEQQRRQQLADVSHELRTPLSVIRGEIEALQDGIRQADPQALASLHAEVLHLNQLVDDLHQLTMADAGDLQYDWQVVELAPLLQPLLLRYQSRARDRGLDLSWQLAPQPLRVRADAGRLTQVLINLLENSLRYTDSGGQIVLTLQLLGAQAEITLEDTAPGVPAGALGQLFERLYRVDAARTRERGGSGLGLAICRALVQAHGGEISASASVLGGVRMQLRLPLCKGS
ncbi:HAMP domain-containing protein [Pseudoduganella sp. FT93W]|uniref:histidine kinase n=1 Tax=Duganella fentianensis TaxID=2692177 RepID=A0A845HY05_9BURK|nr:ATP-binding protein [Duganella fentianensis]MYN44607.1 HAMP domain-containing protein [Duganella fentianensis]